MKNGKRILFGLAALAAAWLFVSPASAQPDPKQKDQAAPAAPSARKGGPCQDDAQKFCKDAGTGAAHMKCMKEHEAELSEPCKQMRERIKERVHKRLDQAKEACQSDIDKYCKDVKEGEGRIAACLKGHVDDLGPRCKIAYDRIDIQVQKRRIIKELAEACKDDSEKFCKDVAAGKGGKIKCLKEHSAELSESCKAALPQRAKKAGKPGKAETKEESGGQEL